MEASIWDQVKRSPKMATCHPDRKHKGHGLCSPCYHPWYHKTHIRPRDPRTIETNAERTERTTRYLARVEASLTGKHCTLCGIDYNPDKKKSNNHPHCCSFCERDMDRSAWQFVNLTPYHKETF